MPLTSKGEKILANMQKQYGAEKGKQVLYASKNKGTITGIDGRPADESYQEAGSALSLAELNANNRAFWERGQRGGTMYPNLGIDEAVVAKETSTSMPNPTPPAGTVKGPVFSAAVPEKALGVTPPGATDEVETIFKARPAEQSPKPPGVDEGVPQQGSWDRLFHGDQGNPDEHEHPENEEIIEEAIEPGLHKRVAQVHKASQEKAKDTEFDEDGVMTSDPHGYRLNADADAKDIFPEMMPPVKKKNKDEEAKDCVAGETELPFGGCRKLHPGEKAPPRQAEGKNITQPFGRSTKAGYAAYMTPGRKHQPETQGAGYQAARQEEKAGKKARKAREASGEAKARFKAVAKAAAKREPFGGVGGSRSEAVKKAWVTRHARGDSGVDAGLNMMPHPTVKSDIGRSTTAVARSVKMKPLGS